ncbi:MAG: hypothetical protein K2W96_01655 [Gemmataceae bacterium]|nr:hypothetical protein [Gemmataceae bacterium]
MRFNPVSWFRKNSKGIFATLIILCMLIFVLQFGQGDLFQRLINWAGGGRAAGPLVAKINGKAVHEGDLEELRRKRKLANTFLLSRVDDGVARTMKDLLDGELKDEADMLGFVLRDIRDSLQQRRPLRDEFAMRTLRDEAAKAKDDKDRLALVERVASVFGFYVWIGTQQLDPSQYFLRGNPQADSLLDFLVWKGQADKMGIVLSDNDVMREINAQAAGHAVFDTKVKSFDREKTVDEYVKAQNDRRLSAAGLMDALRDEFRVAFARELATGIPSGTRMWRMLDGGSTPAVGSPDEYLSFYREATTLLKVRLLRLPAEAFVKDVAESPSEEELRSLYNRHRDQESAPFRREPGFKQGRRIRAEYAIGSPTDPAFLARGREAVWGKQKGEKKADGGLAHAFEDWRRARDVLQFAAMFVHPMGAGPGGLLPKATFIGFDPVQIEQSRHFDKGHPWAHEDQQPPSESDLPFRLDPAKAMGPGVMASLLGSMAGDPRMAANTWFMVTKYRDAGTVLKTNLGVLMGKPTLDGALGNLAATILATPKPTPREAVEGQLLASIQERFAQDAFKESLHKFRDRVKEVADEKAKADVLAKAAAEAHLKLYSMPRAMSGAEIRDAVERKKDIGLGALLELGEEPLTSFERMLEGNPNFGGGGMKRFRGTPEGVSVLLFRDSGKYKPAPVFLFEEGHKRQGLAWRTDDDPPELRSFAQAREDVEKAWRLDKARALARKRALELAEKINSKNGTPKDAAALLAEEAARDSRLGASFEMDNVAMLTEVKQFLAERETQYKPFEMPVEAKAEFAYPSSDLLRRLQELKDEGKAAVLVDEPARNFYVAVLEQRAAPSFHDFAKTYMRTPLRDKLYERFETKRREEYFKAVMEQLRREAAGGKLDKEGRIEIPAETRKRFASGSGPASDD